MLRELRAGGESSPRERGSAVVLDVPGHRGGLLPARAGAAGPSPRRCWRFRVSAVA
ncbi:hypothetical protein KCH_76910 [Kitasatospora cheerisanensis KCTC 2395]|uniref:Uncharacterized protein n=1 Tax=Kitasatospora cheerisanensis KCTC 2395 TaxID=1348663 RepID=A0A066YKT7_9ACTN|nr:hypothetical protein KCH_76910 [Kitasatospora cheerisanensis KCTC 2395]